jgi:prevent-host-death family protein
MTIVRLSSREFNQDASKAKRASLSGPVIITDRGKPSHVLLSIAQYQKLTRKSANIAELLGQSGAEGISFKPVKLKSGLFKPADLS